MLFGIIYRILLEVLPLNILPGELMNTKAGRSFKEPLGCGGRDGEWTRIWNEYTFRDGNKSFS